MTPLAQRVMRELTLPIKRRTLNDKCGILGMMDDIHCFECTAIYEAAGEMWNATAIHARCALMEKIGFLPAPKTWIEYDNARYGRVGLLLVQAATPFEFSVFAVFGPHFTALKIRQDGGKAHDAIVREAGTLLPFINTPRVIGSVQHMPKAGIERKLLRSMGGSFAVHAWTEILLKVTPPDVAEDETEAHLTGTKALHFCRAHLRVSRGQLQLVSAHWRGDPALGIKQSRYRMVQ